MTKYTPDLKEIPQEIPEGYCACGCGKKTKPIRNWLGNGRVKGQPNRFLKGHKKAGPLAERFWSHVDKSGGLNACWPWIRTRINPGSTTEWYGMFCIEKGNNVVASRVAYILTHGAIPDGLVIMHECDNPPCCNPAHLRLGTFSDNMQDCVAKGRAKPPHGQTHPFAKISTKQVNECRKLYATGEWTQRQLAERYGINQKTVSKIVRWERRKNG